MKEQEKQLKHMADEASVELEGYGKGKRSYSKFSYSKKEELQKPPKRSKLNPSQPFQRVLALPRSVKLKLPLKKKNLNFTLPIKKGIIYINISKEEKHLKLPIHINFSRC